GVQCLPDRCEQTGRLPGLTARGYNSTSAARREVAIAAAPRRGRAGLPAQEKGPGREVQAQDAGRAAVFSCRWWSGRLSLASPGTGVRAYLPLLTGGKPGVTSRRASKGIPPARPSRHFHGARIDADEDQR